MGRTGFWDGGSMAEPGSLESSYSGITPFTNSSSASLRVDSLGSVQASRAVWLTPSLPGGTGVTSDGLWLVLPVVASRVGGSAFWRSAVGETLAACRDLRRDTLWLSSGDASTLWLR